MINGMNGIASDDVRVGEDSENNTGNIESQMETDDVMRLARELKIPPSP